MDLAGLRQRPAYFLYHWMWIGLDWLFPPRCAGCGVLGERWCDKCRRSISPFDEPLCLRCGLPIPVNSVSSICFECQKNPPFFTSCRSVCIYKSSARKAIHRLKFGRDIGLGEALADVMLDFLTSLHWTIDLVTCVPLSKERMRERGYNQAAVLARPIALGLNLPFFPQLLRKSREVPSQVGLSAHERRLNVENAFKSSKMIQMSKHILLIDDVATTGSTMNACARALIDAGAQQVYGLTFARAGLNDHNQII
jgi:competence protein ComFC